MSEENIVISDNENNVAISENLEIPEHKILEYKQDIVLVGEGPDKQSALNELKSLALEHHANAILDCKLKYRQNRLSHKSLYTATGLAAIADGMLFKQTPGMHLNLEKNRLRVNSPNLVKIRYFIVLFISLLFIAIPSFIRLAQRFGLNEQVGLIASGVLALLMIGFMLFYFPNSKKRYLVSVRKRNSI